MKLQNNKTKKYLSLFIYLKHKTTKKIKIQLFNIKNIQREREKKKLVDIVLITHKKKKDAEEVEKYIFININLSQNKNKNILINSSKLNY